jgi:hypothetical protein
MEAQPQSGSPSGAAYPRWVMLEQYLEIKVKYSSCSPTDDAKTLAAARTSNCHLIQVSLCLAEPPALSRVFLQIPDGLKEEKSKVLTAHGDSVLIQVCIEEEHQLDYTAEHFVYNAGAPAAEPPRPPSLLLLPPYYEERYIYFADLFEIVPRELSAKSTGLLRRGEDELVVAELTEVSLLLEDTTRVVQLQLYLFRFGEWNCYDIDIREGWDFPSVMRDDRGRPVVSWDTVVPVDDRQLCWVDLCRGVMLVDVFEETPTARYIRLPMDPHEGLTTSNRNVCATAGGGALMFVNIFGRCCCGAAASCGCERSRHAYTIHTWTMRMGNGDMEWVKDGMVDATELWALDAYKGLPCDPLDLPVMSLDEPEVICFRLRDTKYGSRTLWQIMVNMRSKTIHSVSRHEQEVGYRYTQDKLIPSNLSYFFNTLTRQIQMDHERPSADVVEEQLITRDDDSSSPTLQPSSFAEVASVQTLLEMFEALRDIPSYGLGPDEVKAYRILTSSDDDGRRLTFLSRLPKDLRKDWLLMEIEATDAN